MLTKTALIVDDSATAQAVLKKLLAKYDYHADTCDGGQEALAYLGSHRPSVVFLDHIMPGQDGFQILKQIKANSKTQDIPVVMYTSQTAQKYASEAKALGAMAVLTKQVNNESLSLILDRVEKNSLAAADAPLDEIKDNPDISLSELDLDAEADWQARQLKKLLHTELEEQQKNFDKIASQLQEQSNLIRYQQEISRSKIGPIKTFIIALLIITPSVMSWNFYQQLQQQQLDIVQLRGMIDEQNQQLAEAGRALTDSIRYQTATSSQERDDMLFMLETLVASIEQSVFPKTKSPLSPTQTQTAQPDEQENTAETAQEFTKKNPDEE
jgi:CheY-like chemotaxis protein